jgi:hypothetical protein
MLKQEILPVCISGRWHCLLVTETWFGFVRLCSGKEMAEFPIEPEITLELMMAANYLDT